jgi:uncharacterized NAD(P)/FAD-binding protein YdhS/quercetin dioxygenase-like cupin family protein
VPCQIHLLSGGFGRAGAPVTDGSASLLSVKRPAERKLSPVDVDSSLFLPTARSTGSLQARSAPIATGISPIASGILPIGTAIGGIVTGIAKIGGGIGPSRAAIGALASRIGPIAPAIGATGSTIRGIARAIEAIAPPIAPIVVAIARAPSSPAPIGPSIPAIATPIAPTVLPIAPTLAILGVVTLPIALKAIVDELERTSILDAPTLARILRRPIALDDVAPFIKFDASNYVRNLVARTDRWELRVICWRPGQSSAMHSHRGSACAFHVVRGAATETILGSRDRVHAPGAVVEEGDARAVHQVRNAAADPLVSLHIYAPPLAIDAPSPRRGREIVVVGGGASGAAVATHLLRRGDRDLRVTLVERGPWLGRGVAYGVDSRVFRLNVAASKMSLDPAVSDDFQRWAGSGPDEMLPRRAYGAYVVQRLAEAIASSPGKLRVVRGDASAIAKRGSSFVVRLTDGTELEAPTVILATGIAPRVAPSALPDDARIVDAWDELALAALPRTGRVLVLGAGLSAVDVVAWLAARRFEGSITILSRRGLLPRSHLDPPAPPLSLPADEIARIPADLRGLIRWTRAFVRDAVARGEPWQRAIDALRPHTHRLFARMPAADRARFASSVRPFWEVLRHRAPVDALATLREMREAGRLDVRAGRITACRPGPEGLDVELAMADGTTRRERFDHVVRCIGPALDRAEADAPLVRDLVASGLAAADPAGLGIVTDDHGRIVDATGTPNEHLLAVGSPRRASAWETTSMPDIAAHAVEVAERALRGD